MKRRRRKMRFVRRRRRRRTVRMKGTWAMVWTGWI
jgi:hypothetical protein